MLCYMIKYRGSEYCYTRYYRTRERAELAQNVLEIDGTVEQYDVPLHHFWFAEWCQIALQCENRAKLDITNATYWWQIAGFAYNRAKFWAGK